MLLQLYIRYIYMDNYLITRTIVSGPHTSQVHPVNLFELETSPRSSASQETEKSPEAEVPNFWVSRAERKLVESGK